MESFILTEFNSSAHKNRGLQKAIILMRFSKIKFFHYRFALIKSFGGDFHPQSENFIFIFTI